MRGVPQTSRHGSVEFLPGISSGLDGRAQVHRACRQGKARARPRTRQRREPGAGDPSARGNGCLELRRVSREVPRDERTRRACARSRLERAAESPGVARRPRRRHPFLERGARADMGGDATRRRRVARVGAREVRPRDRGQGPRLAPRRSADRQVRSDEDAVLPRRERHTRRARRDRNRVRRARETARGEAQAPAHRVRRCDREAVARGPEEPEEASRSVRHLDVLRVPEPLRACRRREGDPSQPRTAQRTRRFRDSRARRIPLQAREADEGIETVVGPAIRRTL